MGAVCSLEAALLTRNVLKLVLYEPGMNVTGEDIYPPGFIDLRILGFGCRSQIRTLLKTV
jgi:hypothetical protein